MFYRPDCLTDINSERRPWGGGRTHGIWGRGGSRTWATSPTCWRRGVYQVNRARFVDL